MHIEIEREELLRKLEIVSRAATKHLTLPILQCVRIEAKGKTVSFSGTNLEIGIAATVAAVVKEGGVVAVPAQTLVQTVTLAADARVSLVLERNALVIASRGSRTMINTFPATDFPTMPELPSGGQAVIGASFAAALRSVAFAASQSSIKPELGSIYISQKKERSLTFVATDSFRLIEKTVPQDKVTLESPILVPHKNALEIARVLELVSEDPHLVIGEGQAAFRFNDGTYITTRLIEGSFPDYVQIIPKEYKTHATVLSADLAHALKMASVFANKFLQVSLAVEKGSKEIVLTSDSGEFGQTTARVAATIEGDDLTLSFNQRYITDPLSVMQSESIELHFAGIGRPLVFNGVGDQSVRYLVMPMNK